VSRSSYFAMMDTVQQTARLLAPALSRRGRIMIAPPSAHSSSWRVFGGGLTAEVRERRELGICSLVLRGPDEKTLHQGVTGNLPSALRLAVELLYQLCAGGGEAAS
jgi:hypothetical protein